VNANDLYNGFGEVDDDILERSETAARSNKKTAWLKWCAAAACLCLVAACAALLDPDTANNTPVIVSQFKEPSEDKYPIPKSGEYYCNVNVNDARKYYAGQNVKFLLSFNMFNADGEFLSDEEKRLEYQRLIGLGYELYEAEKWTYQGKGERVYFSVVVGLFSEKDLADFNVNPAYGYAFHFESNGDGSPVSISYSDLIAEFSVDTK